MELGIISLVHLHSRPSVLRDKDPSRQSSRVKNSPRRLRVPALQHKFLHFHLRKGQQPAQLRGHKAIAVGQITLLDQDIPIQLEKPNLGLHRRDALTENQPPHHPIQLRQIHLLTRGCPVTLDPTHTDHEIRYPGQLVHPAPGHILTQSAIEHPLP